MLDLYRLRRFFKNKKDLQVMRYTAIRTFSFLISCLAIDFFLFFVANSDNHLISNIAIISALAFLILLIIQTYQYVSERNFQAKSLIKENALEILYLSFKVFDKNEYVLKNLNESFKLDHLSHRNDIPPRLYFEYISCCKELVYRLSLYKKTNEKVPGTFSDEIDEMFRSSQI